MNSFETETVESPPTALPALSPPAAVSSHALMDEGAWIALRDSGIAPLAQTELVTTEHSRAEFLTGAWLLGLLDSIAPQQLRVTDMLAAGRFLNGVIMPRRSSKTTTLLCILLGRCYLRPVHYGAFTLLTTQKKSAERFRLDVYAPIARQWPATTERTVPYGDDKPVRLIRSNGSERVEFANGSVLSVLSPDGDAVRSGAYDTLLLDEGGEATPERGEDVLSAVVPSFDTRPDGQLIVAGTAAKYRTGNVLWDTLENPDAGVIRYTVRDSVGDEELDTWHEAGKLIAAMHPGVGNLTTLQKIEQNYNLLSLEQFAREYLGLFGTDGESSGIFNLSRWADTGDDGALPQLPERFALAFVVHPDQLCASIVASWRDEHGRLVPLLLDHQKGWEWVATRVYNLSRKHGVPIVYDVGSQNALLVVDELNRAKPRPRMEPVKFGDVKKAAALVVDAVERGEVVHYTQQLDLEAAVKLAVKRKAGANGWALGRAEANDDITAAEAWSLAALAYDTAKPARGPMVVAVRS